MPIAFENDVARLSGFCAADEAETLLAWLESGAGRRVDLSALDGLHAAVLQTLMARAGTDAAPPSSPALAAWLPGALGSRGAS
jgi:hypothetical protein